MRFRDEKQLRFSGKGISVRAHELSLPRALQLGAGTTRSDFKLAVPVFIILTLLRLYRSALDPFVFSLLQLSARALAVPLSVYAGTRLPRGFVNWCPQLNILE